MLSLAEVCESGRPAYFFDYGEALAFWRGQLFDLRDWRESLRTGADPSPLPAALLERPVGIEYGWRHADACECGLCRVLALPRALLPARVETPSPLQRASVRPGKGTVAAAPEA